MGKIIFKKYYEESPNTDKIEWIYTLPNFKSITYDMNTPVSPMPMPEEDAEDNILIKIEGNSSQLTINWTIKDMGTVTTVTKKDTDGTESPYAPSSTIRDQIFWFKDTFRADGVNDAFELVIRLDESDISKDITFPGTFSGFNFNMMSPNLLTFNATAKFMEGTIATLYEVDTASAPKNLTLTASSGTINAFWDTPTESGASAITAYKVHYRQVLANQSWSNTNTVGTSPVPTELLDISGSTNLPAGAYEVYVEAFSTGLGVGRASYKKFINVPA
mgnify:CR=1 FL=1|jgi:hypothetical protein|tara:strand:- start:679 stop:1503 length:825 start_codon:yes stop_codon:yes gene_type:complete